jgi:RNA polymerase sigma factor (sigma-70 family)
MAEAAILLGRADPRPAAMRLLGDRALAKLAAAGNRSAFAAIYERHHQALYRYCRSILGNDDDARDALQNTLVSALDALPGEKRDIALRPWLFRVAHNESISLVRRRSPQPDVPLEEADATSSFDCATRERLRSLLGDIGTLPDRQKSALVLRELNGLSYADIAGALSTSPAAAKQAVYEARIALHQLAEGREMGCESARAAISARDGRVLRGRKLRAHLRSCQSCTAFRDSIFARRTQLAALAPPLPAVAAAGIIDGLLRGAGGSGGGWGGLVGGVGAKTAAGGVALKAGSVAMVTAVVGVSAYEVANKVESGHGGAGTAVETSAASGNGGAQAANGVRTGGGTSNGKDAGHQSGEHPSGHGQGAGAHISGGQTRPGDTSTGGGGSTGPSARGGAGSGSTGSAGTTSPGSSASAPGHTGLNPGQSGGTAGPPGQTGAAPGQSGTSPRNSGNAPGHNKP